MGQPFGITSPYVLSIKRIVLFPLYFWNAKKKHFWEKVIYASSVTSVVNKLMFRGR